MRRDLGYPPCGNRLAPTKNPNPIESVYFQFPSPRGEVGLSSNPRETRITSLSKLFPSPRGEVGLSSSDDFYRDLRDRLGFPSPRGEVGLSRVRSGNLTVSEFQTPNLHTFFPCQLLRAY